ncbi:MAG: hypothetical protein WB609_07030 [Candidatus Cybelea sp.]
MRIGCGYCFPLQASRVLTWIGENRYAAGDFDELRNPMTCAHGRVGPLEHERLAPPDCRTDCSDPPFEAGNESPCFVRMVRGFTEKYHRAKYILERARFERNDARIGAQPFRRD